MIFDWVKFIELVEFGNGRQCFVFVIIVDQNSLQHSYSILHNRQDFFFFFFFLYKHANKRELFINYLVTEKVIIREIEIYKHH
jgi:hypothetical protein